MSVTVIEPAPSEATISTRDWGDSVKLTTPARWYESGSAPDSAALRGIESPADSTAEVSCPIRFESTPAGARVERGADTSATAAAAASATAHADPARRGTSTR